MTEQQKSILAAVRLLRALQGLCETAKLYDDNNNFLAERAQEFVTSIMDFKVGEDHVTIQIVQGRFFLNGKRMAYMQKDASLVYNLLRYFMKRGLTGVRFNVSVRDVEVSGIIGFARLLNEAETHEDPMSWLLEEVQIGDFPWVEFVQESGSATSGAATEQKSKSNPLKAYSRALASMQDVTKRVNSKQPTGTRNSIRAVQEMVDIAMANDSALLGLSSIRDYDDYTYIHSVNVAILAVCLGKRIGMSRASLAELGLCALFHDLGKTAIAPEIIKKRERLTEEEYGKIKKHPIHSALIVLSLAISRQILSKVILPPLEHHRKYDLSGYPDTRYRRSLSLFGRVLAIADVFDALTSARVYRSAAFSPNRAVEFMIERMGKDFDPILLKVFVQMLGLCPVGAVVKLDSGEMGLVIKSPENPQEWRPGVLLLQPDGQGGYKKGETVDLAEIDGSSGKYRRNIIECFNPGELGIQPAEFLF